MKKGIAVGMGAAILTIVFIVSWFPTELGFPVHSQPIWKLVVAVCLAVALLFYGSGLWCKGHLRD